MKDALALVLEREVLDARSSLAAFSALEALGLALGLSRCPGRSAEETADHVSSQIIEELSFGGGARRRLTAVVLAALATAPRGRSRWAGHFGTGRAVGRLRGGTIGEHLVVPGTTLDICLRTTCARMITALESLGGRLCVELVATTVGATVEILGDIEVAICATGVDTLAAVFRSQTLTAEMWTGAADGLASPFCAILGVAEAAVIDALVELLLRDLSTVPSKVHGRRRAISPAVIDLLGDPGGMIKRVGASAGTRLDRTWSSSGSFSPPFSPLAIL